MKANKKILFLFIFIPFFLCSCNSNNVGSILLKKDKPRSNYYYTKLFNFVSNNPNFKCLLLDTNFYRKKTLTTEDKNLLLQCLNSVQKKDFIKNKKLNNLPRPKYKIFFKTNENKFIINVYNEELISILPWEGSYEIDLIDISHCPASYNIYNLCKYLINYQ